MLRLSEVAKLYEAHTIMVVYSWKKTEGTISVSRPRVSVGSFGV